MTLPDPTELIRAAEATWPPAETRRVGPFTLRRGLNGGQRVSAASANGPAQSDQIAAAEDGMRAWGQAPLFMIRPEDHELDQQLAARGYRIKDPVAILAAPTPTVAKDRPGRLRAIRVWPPLAIQTELWAAGGIGPGRLAVMERVEGPKITLLGRLGHRSAGCAFIACHNAIAMVHALEVAHVARRQGLARDMMRAAAYWAAENGATTLAALVMTTNAQANPLYASLGMTPVGQYHYCARLDDQS